MPVSPKILREHGCDPKLWKALFAPKDPKDKPAQIKKLETLIQGRILDGQLRCILEYRTWAAVDIAFDAPFSQTTPTFINNLVNRRLKTKEILSELERWGLKEEELFLITTKGNVTTKTLNIPTFYRIFIPLVKAYVTIRWAKLYNERNKNPLLKYEPMQPNAEHRILCEMITYIVSVIGADFGYSTVLRNVIFQVLMYSVCLAFPREVWKSYRQIEEGEDGKDKEVIQREGIRYELPHPSRMFWDLSYPIESFNTDTGCEFAGYWKVVSYGSILDNPVYWNRRAIGYSEKFSGEPPIPFAAEFLKEFFQCTMEFPVPPLAGEQTSRESLQSFYSTVQRDLAVTQTDIFMKMVPAKYGLGTYKFPVWIRFIVASDNTVLYAEPCCYSPVLYAGYDSNSIRGKNSSLALEVLPFQDSVGNTLSQILLTIKQNLLQVNFYDECQIDGASIDQLKNQGEMLLRSFQFLKFNSLKAPRAMTDPAKAIIPMRFEYKDVNPLFQSLNTTLAVLERLLQLSSQESGQSASHQQSKTEVEQIGASTDNRVQFTGGFIDEFIDAWKRQLYDASMAYQSDPVEAMVPSDLPDIEDNLKKMGFDTVGLPGEGRIHVKGPKKRIKLDSFATASKGPERKNDAQTAQVMMQAVMSIVKNPDMMKMLGPKSVMKIIEKAAILAGADKDFKLRPDQKVELDAITKQSEAIQRAAAMHADDSIAKPVAKEIVQMKAQIQTLGQAMENLLVKLGLAKPPPPGQGAPPAPPAPPAQPSTPPPNAPPPGAPPINTPGPGTP